MKEALKELFNAYKHLPVGMLAFSQKRLFFVNAHLRQILLLGTLPGEEVIGIIGSMLGIENPSNDSLYAFFSGNDFFWYKDRLIQIERHESGELSVFVLVRIKSGVVGAIDSSRSIRIIPEPKTSQLASADSERTHTRQLLKEVLGSYEESRIHSVVLYKGIPIKADVSIEAVYQNRIAIRVEKKQLVAAQAGVEWIIGLNHDTVLSGRVVQCLMGNNVVVLEGLQKISAGYHQRSVIRYCVTDPSDVMMIWLKGKEYRFRLRDVSEEGISISVESTQAEALEILSGMRHKAVNAQLVLEQKVVPAAVSPLYEVPLEGGTEVKVAFSMQYDSRNDELLHAWLNARQIMLIKEVRNFIQMVSAAPEAGNDWVI